MVLDENQTGQDFTSAFLGPEISFPASFEGPHFKVACQAHLHGNSDWTSAQGLQHQCRCSFRGMVPWSANRRDFEDCLLEDTVDVRSQLLDQCSRH